MKRKKKKKGTPETVLQKKKRNSFKFVFQKVQAKHGHKIFKLILRIQQNKD